MTLKNGGSAYSSKGAQTTSVENGAQTEQHLAAKRDTALDKLKARSMKLMMGRSKKKRTTLRRSSETARPRAPPPQHHHHQRVVHFRIPESLPQDAEEKGEDFARSNPFRRSSKFRQPLRRVSRAKGSPPPVHFARIRPIPEHPLEDKFAQPDFDQESGGESEGEEEELPPILLQSRLLEASDGETTDSNSEEEAYTVLPAITVAVSSREGCEEGEEKEKEQNGRESADPPPARRESVARNGTLVRRRSSYRASMRRGSRRLSSAAVRRESLATRRSSIVAGPTRRKSTAVPGYVVRRRSVTARSPYDSSPSQARKKRRKQRRARRRPRKIVVIGDMCSGKTSLISAYCRDRFSEVYVPTILTSCMTDADVLGEKIELVVVEVAGRIDYSQFRHCAYHKMDLVILCYSSDSPASLAAIRNHWLPELLQVAPKVPYILVGTKKDIRDEVLCEVELSCQSRRNLAKNTTTTTDGRVAQETRENFVTTSQGMEAAEAIGAKDFIECSAMYREGTRDVFESAAKLALRRSPRRKKKHSQIRTDTCTIL